MLLGLGSLCGLLSLLLSLLLCLLLSLLSLGLLGLDRGELLRLKAHMLGVHWVLVRIRPLLPHLTYLLLLLKCDLLRNHVRLCGLWSAWSLRNKTYTRGLVTK